ncbi:hypothetical protein Asp14428_16360 [Actinoplanes sp. NBRC 14428]|uniref:Putative membrane protein n=1 Tax=Pseudosporangium ferrugineum TaxID=439699 RepID=A0A2T0SB14_9ACTN|nr:SHOCT domain-containing protein [Pseudosporangium ferrugineum]PRY30619.1 putative membrane protein [Pseudosporangium ferrugineum]BCJ50161.1 hypothetical protein Asp14428_16360 [Actinoplanes sp. NBRC 14428]
MMYDGGGMGAGGWILMILTVALLATLVVALVRPLAGPGPADPVGHAEEILADRLARGEISSEEYEQRLHVLRAAHR